MEESSVCWDCGGDGEHYTSHSWTCYTCKGKGRVPLAEAKAHRREETFKKSDIYNIAVNAHYQRVTNFKWDDYIMTIKKAREEWDKQNVE